MAETNIQNDKSNAAPMSLTELEAQQTKSPEQLATEAATKALADQNAAEKAKTDAAEKAKTDAAAAATDEATKKAEEDKKLVEAQAVADKRYAELKAKTAETLTPAEQQELKDLEPEDDAEPGNADEFWGRVNQLHGLDDKSIPVDYKGADPLSPEGVVIREKALMDYAGNQFDGYLRESDPRGYAYLLHRRAGGDDESFFAKPSITLPEYETFKNNVDLQKQVLTKDLQSKGLSDTQVKLIVEQSIKDNKLFDDSDKAYKTREASESKLVDDALKAAADREAAEAKVEAAMVGQIDDIINNSKTEKIVIPDAKKAEFAKAIKNSLIFDGQNFFIMKPFNKENAAEVIQSEYFGHVKGNLKELVERTAGTQAVKGLRLRAKKTEKVITAGGNDSTNHSNFVPLANL